MSSFFTVPSAEKKRKRAATGASQNPKKRLATSASAGGKKGKGLTNGASTSSKKRAERDDSISGSDSDDSAGSGDEGFFEREGSDNDDDHSEEETAAEKRLRLAQRYLEKTKEEVVDLAGFDAADIDRDMIAERLIEDVAESKGKVYRTLADKLAVGGASRIRFVWNNKSTVSSVSVCAPFAYTVTLDGSLVKWRLQDPPAQQWPQTTKRKPKKPPAPPKRRPERVAFARADTRKKADKGYMGHTGGILVVRASQDGKFVVTGGKDKKIVVWNAETLKPLKIFSLHRDEVTGLTFRRGTNQLYSCSRDRTVKVFSLDELAYVESLFGHQDDVTDIDALGAERCVSVGARDRTARWWKIAEETQLVFRGGGPADKKDKTIPAGVHPNSLAHEGSIDRVAMIDDELFVTGGDSGNISLWSIQKKKPLFIMPRAHGIDPATDPSEYLADSDIDPKKLKPQEIPQPQPRWITALRTIPYSDVIFSGSWDGHVRVWRLSADKKKLEVVGVLEAVPYVQPQPSVSAPTEKQVPNGVAHKPASETSMPKPENDETTTPINGIINDISVFERGERGKDGLCVVVATGKEIRLGRWKVMKGARCGSYAFEIPLTALDREVAEEAKEPNGVSSAE